MNSNKNIIHFTQEDIYPDNIIDSQIDRLSYQRKILELFKNIINEIIIIEVTTSSGYCIYCNNMKKIMHQLKEKYSSITFDFAKMNDKTHEHLCDVLTIFGLPSVILFKNITENGSYIKIKRVNGEISFDEFNDIINNFDIEFDDKISFYDKNNQPNDIFI